jgi:predicted RNA polymerase sigma factor
MAVTNKSEEPVTFGILGLLDNTGRFQTSWDNGLIQPGQTFRHKDSLTFSRPGRYTLQLSICLAQREDCLATDENWIRFEPVLELVVQ